MTRRKKMVIAVFRDRFDAERAYDYLYAKGYSDSEINVLMSDRTRSNFYPAVKSDEDHHDAGTKAAEGLGVGGAIGTIVGATLAAVAAASASVVLPGIGLAVAGPVAAALAGGGAGAVTGGVIGALVGAGLTEQNAQAYEEALREGGVVIGVVPHNNDHAADIEEKFREFNGENVCYC
jgi:hypothetical protein